MVINGKVGLQAAGKEGGELVDNFSNALLQQWQNMQEVHVWRCIGTTTTDEHHLRCNVSTTIRNYNRDMISTKKKN